MYNIVIMAYNIFHPDKYIAELKHRQSLDIIEKPIIEKYYSELRAKQKPTLEELLPPPNEQQIRVIVTNELSPILKNTQQVAYVIEELANSNDLLSFYKIGKLFLSSIKDVRNIDSNFLLQLWSKFKTKLLDEHAFSERGVGHKVAQHKKELSTLKLNKFSKVEYPKSQIEPSLETLLEPTHLKHLEYLREIRKESKRPSKIQVNLKPKFPKGYYINEKELLPSNVFENEYSENPHGYKFARKINPKNKHEIRNYQREETTGELIPRLQTAKGKGIIGHTYLTRR